MKDNKALSKIKLSEKQKEIVLYMREGYAIKKGDNFVLLEAKLERPSLATFFALYKKGVIQLDNKFHQIYVLTELGKTIEL